MALRINDDAPGMRSIFNINRSLGAAQDNISRLSSGNRLNRPGVDPGAISMVQRLTADVASQSQALENINQAAPQLQNADSGLNAQQDILIQQRTLALQAANGTTDPAARQALNNEFQQFNQEIDRIAETTDVGQTDLATGGTVEVQAGTTAGAESQVAVDIPQSTAATLGTDTLDISTQGGAQAALAQIDTALTTTSQNRADIGAGMNRLETAARNTQTQFVNTSASRSAMADTDFAAEVSRLTRNQIVGQAGVATLAQFNALRGSALRLFG
ncbi:MAG: hypothetical protein HYY13_03630 [Nitrospirae bacterium]|nr:hypothetical protein [Nitrospirota bacterium]